MSANTGSKTLTQFAIGLRPSIDVDKSVVIRGDLVSGGALTVGEDSLIFGDLHGEESVKVEKSSEVHSSAIANKQLTLEVVGAVVMRVAR